jgi:hypothetical protein
MEGRALGTKYDPDACGAWREGLFFFHADNATGENIVPVIRDNIDRESHIMTDVASCYSKIGSEFSKHDVVDHSRKEYGYTDRKTGEKVNTNTIWGVLFNIEAWNEGCLSALRREAPPPLSGGVRFSLL